MPASCSDHVGVVVFRGLATWIGHVDLPSWEVNQALTSAVYHVYHVRLALITLSSERLFPAICTVCVWLFLSCLIDPQGRGDNFFFPPREGRYVLFVPINLNGRFF